MKKALKVVGVLVVGTFVIVMGIFTVLVAQIAKEDQWYDDWNSSY